MPRSWSWSTSRGSAALGMVVVAVAGVAMGAPLHAATVLERTIDVEIRADGSVVERHHLRVRLDNPNDFARWSPYRIYLDDNRELTDLAAAAIRPDGKTLAVPRRDVDTREVAGEGELHSSRVVRAVNFPAVPVGSTLAADYAVRERPYFPGGQIELGSTERTEALRVSVHGAGAGWRYRLDRGDGSHGKDGSDGALAGLAVQETPGGVTVTATHLPALAPPERAPEAAADGAVLRYAWGDTASWEAMGRWYQTILAQVPRGAEPVRGKARELTAGLTDRGQRLAALTAFARRQVRYVAVEVGIGGYRPHTPQQVIERLWGDCKDKALLLVDLLHEVGIEAYPALALLDSRARVDREFPSPYQFNHMIVAVPAAGLALSPDAPVAGGYLFLDATQDTGGLAWLQPAVQDQETLVVRDGKGELVRTPVRSATEARRLTVTLDLAASGEAKGSARLELTGEGGAAFLHLHDGAKPQEVDRVLRRVFAALLPAGAELADLRWQSVDGGLPEVRLDTKVTIPPLSAVEAGMLPAIPAPGVIDLPPPGLLDGRTLPVVEEPFATRVTWKVNLPRDACKAETADVAAENAVGAFHQTVAVHGRELTIERTAELRQRWVEPTAFPALKEIGLAEARTNKRRLRVSCGG
jgi:hypothetical protein